MYNNWINKASEHRRVKQVLEWSKSYSLPGFGNVPIYTIIGFLYGEFTKDRIMTRANSIAFNLMLAIFPALIFLLTLLPYLPFAVNYTEVLMQTLKGVMPSSAHAYLSDVVNSITERRNDGLLSIGFVLAMIFSSNGMLSLMTAFNKRDRVNYKRRGIIKERLLALALTVIIGLLFIVSLLLIVAGHRFIPLLISQDLQGDGMTFTLQGIKLILTFLFIYSGVTIIYRYAPRLRKRTPFINPGSLMASLLCLVTSIAFSVLVNEFGRYNELYGSFGALIVIMVWLQINAFIILAGFELNASIAVNVQPKSGKKARLKPNDL